MISIEEILKGAKFTDQSPEIRTNLVALLDKLNQIRVKWAKPMTVTSGLRTPDDQIRVYQEKAAKAGVPFDQSKVPMASRHIHGDAADISDPNRELQTWCLENEAFLTQVGVWMEDFSATPNWVHFQGSSPKSGKRWFMP